MHGEICLVDQPVSGPRYFLACLDWISSVAIEIARLKKSNWCSMFTLSKVMPKLFLAFVLIGDRIVVGQGPNSDETGASVKLSVQLIKEGFPSLAKDAREKGNPVQGSIYFAQKELRCTECHLRGGNSMASQIDDQYWLGPNLSQLKSQVADESVIESLLQPSAVIGEGYETTLLITDDGLQFSGRLIEEDRTTVVLQQQVVPYSVLRIPADEVLQRQIGKQSAMPTGLVDVLPNRQAFLDLVSYLYQLRGSADPSVRTSKVADGEELVQSDRVRGLALLDEYRCMQCHQRTISGVSGKRSHSAPVGPNLEHVTQRIDPDYLRRFIANPHGVKPGTVMPDLMAGIKPTQRKVIAGWIVDYLSSLGDHDFESQDLDAESSSRGESLFHSVGCVACHSSPRDQQTSLLSTKSGEPSMGLAGHFDHAEKLSVPRPVPLGILDGKYSSESLTQMLEDPLQARPSGRMPNMGLTHWEAQDIASYLLSLPTQVTSDQTESPQRSQGSQSTNSEDQASIALESIPASNRERRIEAGKDWFAKLNCVQCHQLSGFEKNREFIALEKVDSNHGCLSSKAQQQWSQPHYQMSDLSRKSIQKAIAELDELLPLSEQIQWALESLRCNSCHDRDGIGGVHESVDQFFTTTNQNLGPQGRIPPTLTSVGAKLNKKWLRQVLVTGRSIRPYMRTRMPLFGPHNVEFLLDAFHEVDPPMEEAYVEIADEKETRNAMTEMVGSGGLNCVACHTFQNKGADTMPALDLTEMAERLQPEWFYQYMLSPQSIRPNTVMPSFWPGGKAIRQDLMDGTTQGQISGLWKYLQRGRQAPTPRGLQVEPIELLANRGEAVMLRRSYPNIGKRGIGVGYPAGINLAYDAEQMRLALMWRGGFADPGGVWRGQGHGRVRPLSSDVWSLQVGPDLEQDGKAWLVDDGRPPDHQFTGYFLDAQQRPTFTYRYLGIEVKDYFIDQSGPDSQSELERQSNVNKRSITDQSVTLDRWLSLNSNRKISGLRFRVASGKDIRELGKNAFQIDQRLRVVIPEDLKVEINDRNDLTDLHVWFDADAGETKLEVKYVW